MSYEIFLDAIPVVLSGLWLTLKITLLAFLVGQVVGLPLALARASGLRILNVPAFTYTFLVRGSPLLVQLFIVYYGLGQIEFVRNSIFWPVLRDPVNCAFLTIGLNSAAYVAELLKGAIILVPPGQREVARTLGLSRIQTMTRIVLPQAYRAIIPPLGNELVLVLKASTLASAVTVMEMTGAARAMVAKTYAPFEVFIVAGVLYLLIGMIVSGVFQKLERLFVVPGTTTGRAA
ncbi:MAG TPA: ABC transporter permease subunit [Pararhizobium sp.]|uniref:ABC transporter permease n=1 Tax=Pararhizobium sp. TaxID=1977563 RepID=UPI002BC168A5|nr:ABC transporter permease subunit [Pararhizobium sp.]HTO31516.1 ABC transporter permease subunit [Pararhizobium sp.]